MAQIILIPLAAIDPPLQPMRRESLAEGLEELKADLDKRGQMQPIGVVDLNTGRYRLVWGSRRCAAAEEIGWREIMAKVHSEGSINELESMAAENFQRTQVNPVEEGYFYANLIETTGISVAECARRVHRASATVSRMLSFTTGDEAVRQALSCGEINAGQAEQLNLIRDEIGRAQALTWAKAGLMTARGLHQWRENREVTGISESIEQVAQNLANMPVVDYRTQAKCVLHGEYVELLKAPPRCICDECWALVMEALEALGSIRADRMVPPSD